MHLTHFQCRGFRCLADVAMTPRAGINIIRGDNAQGKTSILEAVLFAATSKSHRTSLENDLVCHGQDQFHIRLTARRKDSTITTEANWWQGAKRFKVNGIAQTRVSEILGRISVVLFSPEDVDLIKGTAAIRRRFLDMELSQLSPQYLMALQNYRQALRQRNELLRNDRPDEDLLESWEAQLTQHGSLLMQRRQDFVEELAGHANRAYQGIAGNEVFSIRYLPDIAVETPLDQAFKKYRAGDIRRRLTGRGPHRDDIEILVNDQPARNFGSQGQQKTAALALKLAEIELIRARIGEYPVLMLDEVLAELDDKRVNHLLKAIPEKVQCLMTTTDLSDRLPAFGPDAQLYRIEGGRLEEE